MSTDEYVPDDDQIEAAYIEFESEPTSRLTDENLLTREEAQGRWSRWLAAHDARVKRDAAREALDGLMRHYASIPDDKARGYENDAEIDVEEYRDTHYPEETPVTVQPTRDQPTTNHDRMNYWWRRATQAEARIKAVEDVLDRAWEEFDNVDVADIRQALEG